MTKFIALLFIILSTNCFAGVSVVGTRFVINDNSPRMRIKIINDNQAEYIVKVAISDNKDQFVISPPLLILPKNASNFVTIINQGVHDTKDHLYSLVVTAIPKVPRIDDKSTISMAMRSNFHLIYRHNDLKNADFKQLKLEKGQNSQFYFKNDSNYALTILFSKQKSNTDAMRRTIKPNDTLLINKQYCQATCNLWVSLIDDNDDAITQSHLTSR